MHQHMFPGVISQFLYFDWTCLPACFQLQPDQVVFETFINREGKEFICAYRAGKRYYLDSWHSQVGKHLCETVIIRILEICKVPVAQSIEQHKQTKYVHFKIVLLLID